MHLGVWDGNDKQRALLWLMFLGGCRQVKKPKGLEDVGDGGDGGHLRSHDHERPLCKDISTNV